MSARTLPQVITSLEATHQYPDLDSKNGIGSKKRAVPAVPNKWFPTAASIEALSAARGRQG